MTLVAGVDGCKSGWIAVMRESTTKKLSCRLVPALKDLLAIEQPKLVAVDIPIGLPKSGSRACDVTARRFLGRPRGSSVFPAPVRGLLGAKDIGEAAKILKEADGRGLQRQVWFLLPKISEADELARELGTKSKRLFEVHPEVSFAIWNDGKPMSHNKKSRRGRSDRQQLIAGRFGKQAFSEVRKSYLCREVAHDDIADAFAALWTAERLLGDRAGSFPARDERDTKGLEMKIWY